MQGPAAQENEYVFPVSGCRVAKPSASRPVVVSGMNGAGMSQRAPRAAGPRWYVVQVVTGKEEAMCRLIERLAPEGSLEECFAPRYATEMKVRGEWVPAQKPLFPGYLIAVTSEPSLLADTLRRTPEFTRLLSVGETFVPLHDQDQAWIGAFTKRGSRVVPMSTGVMEGDHVVVVDGPLVGCEAMIKGVNRHKSLAILEFEICGRKVTTKVGLGIVR